MNSLITLLKKHGVFIHTHIHIHVDVDMDVDVDMRACTHSTTAHLHRSTLASHGINAAMPERFIVLQVRSHIQCGRHTHTQRENDNHTHTHTHLTHTHTPRTHSIARLTKESQLVWSRHVYMIHIYSMY